MVIFLKTRKEESNTSITISYSFSVCSVIVNDPSVNVTLNFGCSHQVIEQE